MAEEVLKSKMVNFLVTDAELNYEDVGEFYEVVGSGNVGVLAGVLEGFRNHYGGLWVGGRVTVTENAVYLNANAMNRMAQDGTLDVEIPMPAIRKVTVEGGFVTKIVRLDTDAYSVKFRCYGAKDVASLIARQALSQSLRRSR
ncbi:hypothetical protein CT157_12315 [Pseudomonas syringae]|uniref:Uncharacterized protein n=1 Tax=Pseudomonas syringae TaxID=317 RepID=A0A3T0JTH7_PSESX|nr:hypothetical protein [Pseudomonas sp. RIT778]AZV26760.1 hypothetical protein CT157_12315 [Pseudomonas syringae]MBX8468823.1 hypothetical protein [Pseudomonas sp. RIT778]